MITSINQSPLYPIANPKSIAFFGASNNYSAMGTSILNSILSDGFEGTIYPVHHREKTISNLPAYASIVSAGFNEVGGEGEERQKELHSKYSGHPVPKKDYLTPN